MNEKSEIKWREKNKREWIERDRNASGTEEGRGSEGSETARTSEI